MAVEGDGDDGEIGGRGRQALKTQHFPHLQGVGARVAGAIFVACDVMHASQWHNPHHPSPITHHPSPFKRLTIAARSKSSMHDCTAFTHNESTPKLHNNAKTKAPYLQAVHCGYAGRHKRKQGVSAAA